MSRQDRLQELLEADIPITKSIGIRVASDMDSCVTLSAPLAANINHKETVFAGSINAVVTLAGWSMLWCLLDAAGLAGKIVIQDSAIQYIHPVTMDFTARCCLPDGDEVARFLSILRKKRRARIALRAEIWETGRLAVSFNGRYVVQLRAT